MAEALDPKDLLLQNKALVGTYVVALAPIVLWFVWLGGKQDEVAKEQGNLETRKGQLDRLHRDVMNPSPNNPVYTRGDVEKLEERRSTYEEQLAALEDEVSESDAALERWFAEFEDLEAGEEPKHADYVTEWDRQIQLIEEEHADLLTDPETGSVQLFREKMAPEQMRAWQKRFWIQKACLEALDAAGAERLSEAVQFDEPRKPAAAAASEEEPPYVTLPAQLSFIGAFTKIPKVVEELLSREIPLRVSSLRVQKHPFEIDKGTEFGFGVNGLDTVFHEHAYGVVVEEQAVLDAHRPWIYEPPVRVELTVEAYDFKNAAPDDGSGSEE